MMRQFEKPLIHAIQDMIYALLASEFPNMPIDEAMKTIVCIRIHPSLFATLVQEMGQWMTTRGTKAFLYDIRLVVDPDVWISLENRPRLGWP